jgi:dTMP kinase
MAEVPPAWLHKLRGRLIVFDGPDGSGKTTQCKRFAALVESAGVRVCHVREPGGTAIGEQIRKVLLDPNNQGMDLRCEMLLYMASRAQLAAERIGPALAEGQFVLADRFVSSTVAYQGAAGGLGIQDILSVAQVAIGDLRPDLTVIFDVDEKTAANRLSGTPRGRQASPLQPTLFTDRMEHKGQAQHRAIRHSYLEQARNDPDHHLVIDASGDEQTVFDDLLRALEPRFD